MATYVIGDVQGCYQSLLALLEKINFDPDRDKLWFAGDLVNRGPDSLNALRLIRQIAKKVVLGNHDLHLLACYYGTKVEPKAKDTIQEILAAPDCEELMEWLRYQPLMVWNRRKNVVMTHAGLPHIWSTEQAYALSKEVNKALRGSQVSEFFDAMYGNVPDTWSDTLQGAERLRTITNYFTRMRFVTETGTLDFSAKESVDSAPPGFRPWFEYPLTDPEVKVFFGHWAALQGHTGKDGLFATDTGCVWGAELTAVHLKSKQRISVACRDRNSFQIQT